MDSHHDSTESLWHASASVPAAAHPAGKMEADIIVVGAGITGLHTALALQAEGRKVVILEAKQPGAGTTGGSSAHLTIAHDQRYHTMIAKHGEEVARAVALGLREAISTIEKLGSECDFKRVPGWLFPARPEDVSEIQKEAEACRQLGLDNRLVPSAPLPFATGESLEFADQAEFHPVKYLAALVREVEAAGVRLYRGVEVQGAEEKGADRVVVSTDRGGIETHHVIFATHFPPSLITEAEAIPYRSYLIAVTAAQPLTPGLYWDTADPYHYLRNVTVDGQTLILVGGADHRTGFAGEQPTPFGNLKQYARGRLAAGSVRHRWSAQYYEPVDGLPFVGALPGKHRVLQASGYSGNGLTFGIVAARLLADLIVGRENRLASALSPSRLQPAISTETFSEGLRTGRRMIGDRFFHEGREVMEKLHPNEGGVFKINGELVAAHRDATGSLIQRSAVCTHMGGIVEWNPHEKSWDCPIHGGRFSCRGARLEGPPGQDLPPAGK